MGRTPSFASSKRLLFEGNSSKAIANMPSESNYQASAAKCIIRTDNTSAPRKKRKERGSKSSRVLSDDESSMLADDVPKKKLSQDIFLGNTSNKDKSVFKHSNLLLQTCSQNIKNALEPKKKRKEKDNVTLLTAVKHQGTIGLREINSMLVCHHCGAKKFEFESPTFCCDNGKIRLAARSIPHELILLFTDTQSQEAEDFRNRIRVYNSIFSFTSFGVKMDTNLASSRRGIYTFRVLGQVFHTLPPLTPHEGKPSHFQLYFWDSCNELTNRMGVFDNADICEDTMKLLIDVMKKNPYAELLYRINDFPSIEDVTLQICKNAGVDQRCYNNPTADQVAAIWVEGNNPNIPYDRDIILHGTDGHKHIIKHYFGCFDPLQYPLLFPNGENGWHQNIPKFMDASIVLQSNHATVNSTNFSSVESILQTEQRAVRNYNKKMVSCREYYCYKFQIRNQNPSVLLYARRLLQQYAVDMYIKLETTRLDYCRNNQAELRSEYYQGIVDSVTCGETRGNEIGKRIVLPASFIGGPRDMRKRYLDAMALVRRFGKPDLFITMTCNPKWKEITDNLLGRQQPQDRPDLTARVFRSKVQDLKKEIIHKAIFGLVAAYDYVVEFQKRGLPHIHMLLILKQSYKINSADQFDDYVSAELPNKEENPRLFDLVTQHMMHGPCGYLNRKNSCMIAGQCKSHYPRKFCAKTVQGEDDYAIYRRRNDGRTVDIRRAKLNNQWVVPYNPYLLLRYDCHINVEICSGLTAVKYLYKYIYKGHDKIAVHIASGNETGTIDEIRNFQDARWVSAQEALWRIFEFDLNEMSPAVINLALHLPNKHCVTFWKNQSLDYVLRQDYNSKTMLTEFFHTCSVSTKAITLLYTEFPEYYVWDNQSKCWYERKKRKVIGRVNATNPNEGERYYLRLLLNHVRGPTSFDYLLIVNGNHCVTFKESAQKRGLLESDQSTFECLNEAVTFQMPHALRRLFATILVYCEPADVRLLWDSYFEAMSEDYQKEFSQNKELILSKTLQSIKIILESMGKHIGAFDLPQIPLDMNQCNKPFFREIEEETSLQISEDDYLAQFKLNSAQHEAFQKIPECVNQGNGGLFFVNGPGGTGKTFLYRALLAKVRKKNMIALATANSGVAASILPGGRTAHSRFKIPIDLHEESYCTIAKQSGLAELLRRTHLIIWDEAPMAKKTAIEAVDRSLQDITGIDKYFGGKVVVLGGDFMQVLPVIPKATIQETINASLVKSYLFSEMTQLTLFENMRAKTDPIFCDYLLRIGNGTEATDNEGNVKILDEMLIKFDDDGEETSEQKLINEIFPEMEKNCHSATYITNRAILASKNEYVDRLNEKIIQIFPGESRVFTSFDEAIDDSHNFYPQEFLNSLTPNGMPPHRLVLKNGCTVMLLRNLDPSDGLCNGTRMVCRSFENNVIYAEITIGQHTGKQVFIPRIPLSPAENEGYPFQFRRKQFPIRLCFAMTINKAQGQTIPTVGVYLPHPVFSHGQLYVALSRGTSRETTKVLIRPDTARDTDDTRTKNVVYREILDRNL